MAYTSIEPDASPCLAASPIPNKLPTSTLTSWVWDFCGNSKANAYTSKPVLISISIYEIFNVEHRVVPYDLVGAGVSRHFASQILHLS